MQGGATVSNSDPLTGQAGWYAVRVRIYPAEPGEQPASWPQAETAMGPVPGMRSAPKRRGWMAGRGGKEWGEQGEPAGHRHSS